MYASCYVAQHLALLLLCLLLCVALGSGQANSTGRGEQAGRWLLENGELQRHFLFVCNRMMRAASAGVRATQTIGRSSVRVVLLQCETARAEHCLRRMVCSNGSEMMQATVPLKRDPIVWHVTLHVSASGFAAFRGKRKRLSFLERGVAPSTLRSVSEIQLVVDRTGTPRGEVPPFRPLGGSD